MAENERIDDPFKSPIESDGEPPVASSRSSRSYLTEIYILFFISPIGIGFYYSILFTSKEERAFAYIAPWIFFIAWSEYRAVQAIKLLR